jgi:hypothetical protein
MITIVSHDEDGTLNVEWIEDTFRFVISHEDDKWYWIYVTKENLESGDIPNELIEAIQKRRSKRGHHDYPTPSR